MRRFGTALGKHPVAPSLDRRDSRGGYTVDNVRLVRVCVNFGMGPWGQEAYLHCARAAVEHDRLGNTDLVPPSPAKQSLPGQDRCGPIIPRAAPGSDRHRLRQNRIDAAEMVATTLNGDAPSRQRRRIASLKQRILTMGPERLSLTGHRAAAKRTG